MSQSNLFEFVDERSVVDLTKSLVRIPSVTGNEKEIADFVAETLEGMGLEVQVEEAEPGRPNIVGRLPGGEGTPVLILNGHLDVVPPGDGSKWRFDPFSAEEVEGRIYGRGTCDMKGGLASMLEAIKAVRRSGVELRGDLIFEAVVDEERGSYKGTKHLVDRGVTGDFAIVGEPSTLDIQIAHKGDLGMEVETRGKAAHAANPDRGINAIHRMNDVMSALLTIPEKFNWVNKQHNLVGPPYINVSVIHGGIQRNMVPDKCRIIVDRRVVPTLETLDEAKTEIEAVLNELRMRDRSLDVEMKVILEVEACEISEGERIVEAMKLSFEKAVGRRAHVSGTSPFSDAHFLVNQGGIPTVMFGPGNNDQAHTENEYVEIGQLVDAAKVYTQTIVDLLS